MLKYSPLNILILICLACTVSGCWNSAELNNMSVLSAFGIDKTDQPGKVQITAQVIKPGAIKTPEKGKGGEEKAFANIKATGETIFEAIRKATHEDDRKIYWGHNQVVVLSEDIAKEGITKYLDFLARDHEARRSMWVIISTSKASEVLDVKPEFEALTGLYLHKLVDMRRATSETSGVTLHQFLQRIVSKTTAPVASLIKPVGEGNEKKLKLEGTAVFKKDKMVGELNVKETRGLLWVLGEVKGGIIVVDWLEGDGKAGFEIIRARSKIIPEIRENTVYIIVEITEQGRVGELMGPENLTPSSIPTLEKRKAAVIHDEVITAWEKARKLNADIFGFGEAVHRKYPNEWKKLENEWDTIFPNLEVTVIVDTKIGNTGALTKWLTPE